LFGDFPLAGFSFHPPMAAEGAGQARIFVSGGKTKGGSAGPQIAGKPSKF
jgi:hypothetical protein